jgi:hypothetical protein
MSKTKVTIENLDVALSWFDELCCTTGLEECDRVLHDESLLVLRGRSLDISKSALAFLDRSIRYRLGKSKIKCITHLKNTVNNSPQATDLRILEHIVSLIKDDEDCRKELVTSFKDNLPGTITDEQLEMMIQNGILPQYLWSQVCWQNETEYIKKQCPDPQKRWSEFNWNAFY